jgi:GTP cyclohydrolase III
VTMQAERHERLAENVAIAGDCSLTEARAILALIASRLADVTPEMVEAWGFTPIDAKRVWRAMLAASALVKEGKK